ncbi:MAG: hypothetical protein LQ348_005057 [Seirophora lacunosa]|nr:MAG: hypothetical protein LQ348_005057 [Seirophora lacunosa]
MADHARVTHPGSTDPTEALVQREVDAFDRRRVNVKDQKKLKEMEARCEEAAKKGDFTPQWDMRTEVLADLLANVEDGMKPGCPQKPRKRARRKKKAKGKESVQAGPSAEPSLPGTPSNPITPEAERSAKGKEPVRRGPPPKFGCFETPSRASSHRGKESAKGKEPVRGGPSIEPDPPKTPSRPTSPKPKKSAKGKEPVQQDPSVEASRSETPWEPVTPKPKKSAKGKEPVREGPSIKVSLHETPREAVTPKRRPRLRVNQEGTALVVSDSSTSTLSEASRAKKGKDESTTSTPQKTIIMGPFKDMAAAMKRRAELEKSNGFQGKSTWGKEAGIEYDSGQIVRGVKINCTREVVRSGKRYEVFESPNGEDIGKSPPVEMSELIELPLFCTRIRMDKEVNPLAENAFRRGTDNPYKWGQVDAPYQKPGDVLAFRCDGKELLPAHFEAFLVWVHTVFAGGLIGPRAREMPKGWQDNQLNEFTRRATRKNFEAFWQYWQGFGNLHDLPSPYEM